MLATTLADEIRRRLGPVPELSSLPLISIVVLNRDGVDHLRRLLAGLVERTDYPHLELILVDNGSSDESLEFIRSVQAPFPISIIANPHNESFSDANNQGGELASGELLLFLNNDIEPFEPGWLRELVACLQETGAGAVLSTLIYPDAEGGATSGYRVQTGRHRLRERAGMIAVDSAGQGRGLFDDGFGEDIESVTAIGASILIDPKLFEQVGRFTHGFFYGGEDDDLFLKLREQGMSARYSGRSVLIHHISSTSRELLGDRGGPIRRGNSLLLLKRWGPRIWRENALGRLAGDSIFAAPDQEVPPELASPEAVLSLGFCLRADRASAEEVRWLEALEAELRRRGHRCLTLRDAPQEDPRAFFHDVAVHLRGSARYIPVPAQLNVLWVVSNPEKLSGIECAQYDLVLIDDADHAARLREECEATPVIVLEGDRPAGDLIDAMHARAVEIDFPTRVERILERVSQDR